MNKKRSFLVKFTLLLSAFMVQGDPMILQPNIASIAEDFPNYAYSTITMVMTISAVFVGVASFSVGGLAKRIHKKKLLLAGTALFVAGGTLTSLMPAFSLILVTRLAEGFGAGIVITTSMTMIPELYPDENEANAILGMNGVATAVWGAVIGAVSGWLGVISWRVANLIYLAGIVIFVFQLLALPGEREKQLYHEIRQERSITRPAVRVGVMAFLFAVVSTMFMTSVSAFVVESGLGDSSQAGMTITVMTVGSFVIGFVFFRIFARLKNLTPAVSYVLMLAGVLLPVLITAYWSVLAGAAVFGMGYGIYFPYINAECIRVSPAENCDANLSLVNGCYYIGMFASSFLMGAVNTLFHDSTARFDYIFMSCAFCAFVIYYLILAAAEKRKKRNGYEC